MITAEQAADVLKEVATTERRSAEAYSYSQTAPHCFVWGAVWFLGYGAEALAPIAHPQWMWLGWWWLGWWWLALSMSGALASTLIGVQQGSRRNSNAWRMTALFAIMWLFTLALFQIMHARELQIAAYFPLAFSAIYAAIGLWLGLRYILVGIFMAVSTLGAYYFLREHFLLWMALVGGGSLLLTGLWMRKA
jgi:hypothetical protein